MIAQPQLNTVAVSQHHQRMSLLGTSHPDTVPLRLRSGCCSTTQYDRTILVDDLRPTSIRTLCTCPGDIHITSSVLRLYSLMESLPRLGGLFIDHFLTPPPSNPKLHAPIIRGHGTQYSPPSSFRQELCLPQGDLDES